MSSTTEAMVIRLLEDPETIDRFIKKNQKRLAKSYTVAVDTLRAHNIPFVPAQGGHFIWIDLRQYIPPSLLHLAEAGHREAEYMLFKTMIDEGVYLNLGEAFAMRKVGFFRLSFSVPVPTLKIGLERLIRACQAVSEYPYPN
jgi:bifunctional pyridoxal-dependent enzyme with beta-cystathionase and maltose regulon repressor activities